MRLGRAEREQVEPVAIRPRVRAARGSDPPRGCWTAPVWGVRPEQGQGRRGLDVGRARCLPLPYKDGLNEPKWDTFGNIGLVTWVFEQENGT
jgi:hypothetical protein